MCQRDLRTEWHLESVLQCLSVLSLRLDSLFRCVLKYAAGKLLVHFNLEFYWSVFQDQRNTFVCFDPFLHRPRMTKTVISYPWLNAKPCRNYNDQTQALTLSMPHGGAICTAIMCIHPLLSSVHAVSSVITRAHCHDFASASLCNPMHYFYASKKDTLYWPCQRESRRQSGNQSSRSWPCYAVFVSRAVYNWSIILDTCKRFVSVQGDLSSWINRYWERKKSLIKERTLCLSDVNSIALSLSLHGKCDQQVMCLNNLSSLVHASVTELLYTVLKRLPWCMSQNMVISCISSNVTFKFKIFSPK